jgi:hypothetical protein
MIKSAAQSSILNDTRYTSMSAGVVPSTEYLIESRILVSNTSSIIFNNLAQFAGVYKHLKIVMSTRREIAGTLAWNFLKFNGSSSGYRGHQLAGDGGAVGSGVFSEGDRIIVGLTFGNTAASGAYGAHEIDILDAFSSSKNKVVRGLYGSSYIVLGSGVWLNTEPITNIEIASMSDTFLAGSRFSLYGVTA